MIYNLGACKWTWDKGTHDSDKRWTQRMAIVKKIGYHTMGYNNYKIKIYVNNIYIKFIDFE